MGIVEVLTSIVAPLIVALVQASIKAGQSLGLDPVQLRAAIAVELKSQAATIEAEIAEVEAEIAAAKADLVKP